MGYVFLCVYKKVVNHHFLLGASQFTLPRAPQSLRMALSVMYWYSLYTGTINTCTTSPISSYEVQIDYINNGGRSTERSSVSGDITSILMSDLFAGHPLPDTTYNITVIAVNEGGRSIANAPTCMCVLYVSIWLCEYDVFTQPVNKVEIFLAVIP